MESRAELHSRLARELALDLAKRDAKAKQKRIGDIMLTPEQVIFKKKPIKWLLLRSHGEPLGFRFRLIGLGASRRHAGAGGGAS